MKAIRSAELIGQLCEEIDSLNGLLRIADERAKHLQEDRDAFMRDAHSYAKQLGLDSVRGPVVFE